MPIVKVRRYECPFVQLDKRIVEDVRLSWKAKGLLSYLLSRPDDWQIWVADLVKRSTDGEYAVRTALEELLEIGYAERTQEKGEDGQFQEVIYTIHEQPLRGFPQADFPDAENRVHTNNDVTDKNVTNNLPAAPQRKSHPEPPEGDNGDQPVDTYLPDAETQLDILFGPGGKRKGRSWSVPAGAGGADSLGDALLPIFCAGVDFPVEALKPKEQRQWAAELRKVAEGRGATVEQAIAALNAYFDPQGEFNWKVKSVSAPFQTGFQTDWNKLLARAVEGQPLIMPSPVPRKHKEIRYGGRSDFPD